MSLPGYESFEVDGTTFYLKKMPVLQALDLSSEVGTLVAGAFKAGSDMSNGKKFDLSCLKSLRPIAEAFFPLTKVELNGKPVDMNPGVSEHTFGGKNVRLLCWLTECISRQFADFLESAGQTLLISHMSKFASHLGVGGKSGESQPIPE